MMRPLASSRRYGISQPLGGVWLLMLMHLLVLVTGASESRIKLRTAIMSFDEYSQQFCSRGQVTQFQQSLMETEGYDLVFSSFGLLLGQVETQSLKDICSVISFDSVIDDSQNQEDGDGNFGMDPESAIFRLLNGATTNPLTNPWSLRNNKLYLFGQSGV